MNGFYPMLNEVHDKAVRDLPLAECALFEHIWRKLIGWNQFEDEISISQLAKETSACRATIINLLNNLEEKRWIIVSRQNSVTNRKFTSKIAIPACPGIKSRLGWSNNHTRGSTESIPGGGLESRHTTDSSPKDSSKNSSSKKVTSRRDEILPNGMTRGLLLKMLEWKPGVITYRDPGDMERLEYLGTQPEDRIKAGVDETKEKNIAATAILKWVFNTVDQWDYRNGGGNDGGGDRRAEWEKELKQMEAELAVEMKDPLEKNVPWVKQTRERIANRRQALKG